MISQFLFQIPGQYEAAMAAGDLVRFGGILKDSGTGQIVAHLQESGLASSMLNGLGSIPFSPLSALDLAVQVRNDIKLDQLSTMVQGLQTLQYATLGVAVAGIGVSVIGFAMLNRKLNKIQDQITQISDQIDQQFLQLHERELRSHFSLLRGLFQQADQAAYLNNPADEWIRISHSLADESAFLAGELAYLLEQKIFDGNLFDSLVQALTLCNSGRVEALVMANEIPAAKKSAEDMARNYRSLFEDLSPVNLASKMADATDSWDRKSFNKSRSLQMEARNILVGVKELTENALTKPHLLQTLIERDVDGYEYVTTLRQEDKHPLLLLQA